MKIIEIIYVLAACVSIAAMIPQIRRLLTTKRSDELSASAWAVWTMYQVLAVTYAMSVGAVMYMIISIISVPLYATVFFLIIKYRNNPQPLEPQPVRETISDEQR